MDTLRNSYNRYLRFFIPIMQLGTMDHYLNCILAMFYQWRVKINKFVTNSAHSHGDGRLLADTLRRLE